MARADAAEPQNEQNATSQQLLLSMDDFKHFKQIGKGKDCVVYSATCEKLGGATVVLKVYEKAKISAIKQRSVRREARIMRYLTEKGIPHTTAYTGAFQDSKQIYIVMEHCGRGDLLEQLLREGRAMAEKRVVREVVLPSLTALAYLHAAGIIHRDIKLENLFISNSGHLQLGDFGLAISVLEERPISPVGTLEYMSPEILRLPPTDSVVRGLVSVEDISPVDEKVDIWSFGVTVYELVTGRSPFEGNGKDEVKAAILAHRMRPLPSFLTAGCQDFISRCLNPQAAQRPGALTLLSHPWVAGHCSAADLLTIAKLPTQLPRRPMGHRHQQQLLQQAQQAAAAAKAAEASPANSSSSSTTTTAAPAPAAAAAAAAQQSPVPAAPAAAKAEPAAAAAGKAEPGIHSAPGSPQIPAYMPTAGGSTGSTAPPQVSNSSSSNSNSSSPLASAARPPLGDLPAGNSSGSSASSSAASCAASMADSAASLHHHAFDQASPASKAAAVAAAAKKLACQEPIFERPADESAAAATVAAHAGSGTKQQHLKDITRVEVLPAASSSSSSKGGSKKQQQQPGGKKLFKWMCLAAGAGSPSTSSS